MMSDQARIEFSSPSRFSVMDAVPIDMFIAVLIIDGIINAKDWQCKAVLVACEEPGRVPRYFNCCDEKGHHGRVHECGNGSTWWHDDDDVLHFDGTLYDVTTDNVVRKNEDGQLVTTDGTPYVGAWTDWGTDVVGT